MYHCPTQRVSPESSHAANKEEAGVETGGGSPGPGIFMVTIMTHDKEGSGGGIISPSCSDKGK